MVAQRPLHRRSRVSHRYLIPKRSLRTPLRASARCNFLKVNPR
jgi:hypothetical protein